MQLDTFNLDVVFISNTLCNLEMDTLTILSHLIFAVSLVHVYGGYCPQYCICDEDVMTCDRSPDGHLKVKKLVLKLERLDDIETHLSVLRRQDNLRELDISANNCTKVDGMPFLNFSQLHVLGLHVKSTCLFGEEVFYGLNNVKILDMSGNINLHLADILVPLRKTFNTEPVFPSLETIIFDKIQTSFIEPIRLDENFFKVLIKDRRLETIQISSVQIGIADYNALMYACSTLKYLIIRNSTVTYPKNFVQPPCASLRTLDISGTFIPSTQDILEKSDLGCWNFKVYSFVENILMRNVFKTAVSVKIDIQDYILDFSPCPFHFRKFDASFNTFRWLNLTAILSPDIEPSLVVLDLSHNIIQYISPNLLNPSRNLEIVNISHNQLGYMQRQFPSDFEIIFSALTRLKQIILSSNDLDYIPADTFVFNNKLQKVDLSDNKLSSITFKLNHMHDLILFNVSRNLFKVLDEQSFIFFSRFQGLGSGISRFQIDLSNNVFVCSCSASIMKFIKWLHYSPLVSNGTYRCSRDNELLDVSNNAVEDMETHCETQKRLRILMIAGPPALFTILVCVLTAVCFIRKLWRKERLNKLIRNLENEGIENRLIFLCHCSDDKDIADQILDKLNREMKLLTNVEMNYVSLGDVVFRPGFPVLQELIRNIRQCGVVVCIVSNMFCQKHWCQMEVREAQRQKKPVILIMVERVERRAMDASVKDMFERNAHASWTDGPDGGRMEPDWPNLCQSVLELVIDS